MTDDEVFNEITSQHKWYAGFVSAQYAANFKRKFKQGNISLKTLSRFFNHFGYEMKTEWHKSENTSSH